MHGRNLQMLQKHVGHGPLTQDRQPAQNVGGPGIRTRALLELDMVTKRSTQHKLQESIVSYTNIRSNNLGINSITITITIIN